MSASHPHAQQVAADNPWYTTPQLPTLGDPAYARVIHQRWSFFQQVLGNLRKRKPRLKVLDAGCGDGVNLTFLAGLPDLNLHALDYNPLRLERASQTFPTVHFQQADLTDNSYLEGGFDCIILSQVLEHIQKDLFVLKRLTSLLSPGGRLVIGVPNEGCFLAWLRNHVLFPQLARTTDHVHFYTLDALRRLFSETGLREEAILAEGFFYPALRMHQFFARGVTRFAFSQALGRLLPRLAAGFYFSLCYGHGGPAAGGPVTQEGAGPS